MMMVMMDDGGGRWKRIYEIDRLMRASVFRGGGRYRVISVTEL
jgi:hypothetical protein